MVLMAALCSVVSLSLLLSRVPLDMLHMTETTCAEFSLDYDCHGDSYYDDTDVDGLKKLFDKITPKVSTA